MYLENIFEVMGYLIGFGIFSRSTIDIPKLEFLKPSLSEIYIDGIMMSVS